MSRNSTGARHPYPNVSTTGVIDILSLKIIYIEVEGRKKYLVVTSDSKKPGQTAVLYHYILWFVRVF